MVSCAWMLFTPPPVPVTPPAATPEAGTAEAGTAEAGPEANHAAAPGHAAAGARDGDGPVG